jgi:hypothetical protein
MASFTNLKETSTSVTAGQLHQCVSVCDSLYTPIGTVTLSRLAGILTTWIYKCSCSLESEDEGSCCGLSTPFGMHFVTVAAGRRINLSGHCNRPASLRRANRLRWRFPLIGSGVWGSSHSTTLGFVSATSVLVRPQVASPKPQLTSAAPHLQFHPRNESAAWHWQLLCRLIYRLHYPSASSDLVPSAAPSHVPKPYCTVALALLALPRPPSESGTFTSTSKPTVDNVGHCPLR